MANSTVTHASTKLINIQEVEEGAEKAEGWGRGEHCHTDTAMKFYSGYEVWCAFSESLFTNRRDNM